MHFRIAKRIESFILTAIKLIIIVGVCYFIYQKLFNNERLDFNAFISFLRKNELFSLKNFSFLIILSCFNWFFEILKWKNLVSTIKAISYNEAFKQSLGSLTASLITPNRIGEYGAKAIYFKPQLRKQIVLLNFLGNVAQMSVTTLFGCIALAIFNTKYNIVPNFYLIGLLLLGIVILVLLVTHKLGRKKITVRGFSFERIFEFIKEQISIQTHTLNFVFSLLRYAIFSFQFYYLLLLFNIGIDYSTAMIAICSMYLLASIIPSLAFFDVVIKTGAAVFIFNYLGVDELTILSITTLMWLLNFILPSLLGSYFVINFNLSKSRI